MERTVEKRGKKMLLCMLCLVLLAVLPAGCASGGEPDEPAAAVMTTGSTLPGADEIYPTIQYNGRMYEWNMMRSDLPLGFEEVGPLQWEKTPAPAGELYLASTFEATGTVYASADRVDTIIVKMTTSWFEDQYVKFVCADADAAETA